MKLLEVHNKANFPTCNFLEIKELQGDFKKQTHKQFIKLKNTLLKRGIKYPFIVWVDEEGQKWTIDGHQRLKVLQYLQERNYEIPVMPYYEIQAESKKEAIEEIAYVNSRYSNIDKKTSLFSDFDIDLLELDINIPELDIIKFKEEVENGEECIYPLVPFFDEKYSAVVIICTTQTELAIIKTCLGISGTVKSYKNKFLGEANVVMAKDVKFNG